MDEILKQAYADWNNGKAYIDNNGNYHIRKTGSSSGAIASWNKNIKTMYKDVSEFHQEAHKYFTNNL